MQITKNTPCVFSENKELENGSRLAYLEVEVGRCAALFCQHDCGIADRAYCGLLSLSALFPVTYPQRLFASRPAWYWHILLFLLFWGILMFVSFLVGRMPLISGGGIPQTRGAINGRITYKHPFVELVSKFAGGILSVAAGLSLGREGPSVQIGSYIGSLVSRWTHILQGERKQLLAAGAGAGLAAAFAAPLASSLIVIESIERFDAPKTAITTLLAGVVAGAVAGLVFPVNPYHLIEVSEPVLTFLVRMKYFLLLAVIIPLPARYTLCL